MTDFGPRTMEGFLSEVDDDLLRNYCGGQAAWGEMKPDNFWAGRTVNYRNVEEPEIRDVMARIATGARDFILREYGESEIYADTMDLVRWPVGFSQPPHCDDMSDNEQQHPGFSHRKYGCIVYLNDDYGGGHTYYPGRNLSVKPKRGMLAVHPGDCESRHGVTAIEGTTRYTVASFWTMDRGKAMGGISW